MLCSHEEKHLRYGLRDERSSSWNEDLEVRQRQGSSEAAATMSRPKFCTQHSFARSSHLLPPLPTPTTANDGRHRDVFRPRRQTNRRSAGGILQSRQSINDSKRPNTLKNALTSYRTMSGHRPPPKQNHSIGVKVLPHWREGRRQGGVTPLPSCAQKHLQSHSFRDAQQVSQSIRRACVAVGITFAVSSESQIDKRQNTTLAALALRRSIN